MPKKLASRNVLLAKISKVHLCLKNLQFVSWWVRSIWLKYALDRFKHEQHWSPLWWVCLIWLKYLLDGFWHQQHALVTSSTISKGLRREPVELFRNAGESEMLKSEYTWCCNLHFGKHRILVASIGFLESGWSWMFSPLEELFRQFLHRVPHQET